jgi:5-formyltetrahydrofolate cyclo-ligase
MEKKELRALVREKKRALTPAQIESCSSRLAERLYQSPYWQEAKAVYGYLSFNQEVRTLPILTRALAEGKRVAIPKVYGKEMRFIWMDDLSLTAKSAFGVPEPVADGPVADDPEALILLPGVAFDRAGNRCGYGGGYYDRYLAAHPGHRTAALCYDFQLFDRLETEEYDLPADVVLAEPVAGGAPC